MKRAILSHNAAMNRILIVGAGDIALRLLPRLRNQQQVYALTRNPARADVLRQAGALPLPGNLDDRASLRRLAGLADTVLHLAPPPETGERDTRTCHLLAALAQGTLPKRFIYISTSGVYGDCGGAKIDETRVVRPQSLRAWRRADAERQIRIWAQRNGVQACILRVPGIYAAERLPLERIRNGTPAIAAAEDSYTNHIHADDLARILIAAMQRGKPNRVYHASDDGEMKMGEYFDAVAAAYGLSKPPRLPRAEAERTVSPALWSFMRESRRLDNARMKRELQVTLRYLTVMDGLGQVGLFQPEQ